MAECWGYHASEVPADEDMVVDMPGRRFKRHHGGWIHVATVDGRTEYGSWMTEERLLTEFGPVRCSTTERLLAGVQERRAAR